MRSLAPVIGIRKIGIIRTLGVPESLAKGIMEIDGGTRQVIYDIEVGRHCKSLVPKINQHFVDFYNGEIRVIQWENPFIYKLCIFSTLLPQQLHYLMERMAHHLSRGQPVIVLQGCIRASLHKRSHHL